MDTTEKNEGINNEVIQLVLEEIAQEQRTNTQTVNDMTTAVNGLSNKIDQLKREVDSPKPTPGNIDVQDIKDIVDKRMDHIVVKIDERLERPKKYPILLFPEQDRVLFYKIVFGRWFLYLVIMLFLNNLYKWGVHYSDMQKEIQLEQLQNDHIKRAWDSLYQNNGKVVRKLMNEAYSRSEQTAGK